MNSIKHAYAFVVQFVLLAMLVTGCSSNGKMKVQKQESAYRQAASDFPLKKGTNISHWLSQTKARGEKRRKFFTKQDIKKIADKGFDFIRIPIDEKQMWDEQGNKHEQAFGLLHNALDWCQTYGLRAIVDLHILRSHHFNQAEKPLWNSSESRKQFIERWQDLSDELHNYSTAAVAYELLNEPVAPIPEDWNQLAARAVKIIRKKEPERKIVIGSNRWQSTSTFKDLEVPKKDTNIILSFHFYEPHLFTHYQAPWVGSGRYKGPIHYPGKLVRDADIADLSGSLKAEVQNKNGIVTKDTLKKHILMAVKKARKLGLQIFCGEFGVYSKVPDDMRYRWYRDVQDIFATHNIGYASWDYKSNSFGLVNDEGQPDQKLIDILTGH